MFATAVDGETSTVWGALMWVFVGALFAGVATVAVQCLRAWRQPVRLVLPPWAWLHRPGQYFFGRGIASLELVLSESSKGGFRPWVVPGDGGGPPLVIVPDYDDALSILRKHTDKGAMPRALYYPGTPRTVVTSNGQPWRSRRLVLNSALTHAAVVAAAPDINAVFASSVGQLAAGKSGGAAAAAAASGSAVVELGDVTGRAVLDVVGCFLFGQPFGAVTDPANQAMRAAHEVSKLSLLNWTNPVRRWLRIGRATWDRWNAVFDDVARAHMARSDTDDTVTRQLQQAVDATTGKPVWNEADLLEEMRLVVNASHDPALPLSFALWHVARQPDLARRLREESNLVLGTDRPDAEIPAPATKRLLLANAVWLESLRLFPVSGIGTVRRLESDHRLPSSSVVLRAGTHAIVPFFTIMRSPLVFDNPLKFAPERFLAPGDAAASAASAASSSEAAASAQAASKASSRVQLVFSDGARICAGRELAHLEGVIGLVRMVRALDLTATDADFDFDCGIHCMSAGMNVHVQPRAQSSDA